MPRYHVYGVGNALVDMEYAINDTTLNTLQVDKGLMTLIEEDRHHELLEHLGHTPEKRASGGSAANTIIACAQLGGDTYYSCKVADDPWGHFYLGDLEACSVHSNLHQDSLTAGVTGKCIVLVTPDAERSMNTYLGITREISVAELDEAAIRDSQYVYIEGYLVPEPAAREAAVRTREIAVEAGVKTALTLSDENMVRFFRDGLMAIAEPGLDLVFCNEDEARLMFNADSTAACVDGLKSIARQFAMTRGAEGALVFDGNELLEIPAVPVTPIDTNGAGDMYAGAFLYGLTHGLSFGDCGRLAARAASRLITEYGARLSIDDMRAIGREFSA